MSTGGESTDTFGADGQRRYYNPYENLGPIDYRPLRNIYELPTSPEFLFPEEAAAQRRSWGENIQYYAGCGYLTGAVAGASVGLVQGLKAKEPGDTMKVQVNRILNASGHTGRKIGNRLGVIGLMYAGLESGIVYSRNGVDDVWNNVAAGLATGALFKAASGPRSAAVAGAIGGILAGGVVAGRHVLSVFAIVVCCC